MNESVREDRALRLILAAVLVTIGVGSAIDLYFDELDTLWSAHALFELALIAVAMSSSIALWLGWWRSRRSLAEARRAMARHAAEREAWRAGAEAALAGFAQAMDDRFSVWGLTPTERDIALERPSPVQIAHTTDAMSRDAIRRLDGDDVDAIVQVGTNMSMVRLAAAAELFLGKPVIAINTATYWHALRAAGLQDKLEGFGSLLSHH